MSVYRRNHAEGRCQRWEFDTTTWTDCQFNEPETRQRKPDEGMVVDNGCRDFAAVGPLTLRVADVLEDLER